MTAQDDPTQQRIDALVKEHDVILFMKGTRTFPQCGFSATVVNLLNDVVDDYETVNVLAEPPVRQGIKVYSDWPTIPQLYIRGEFVGGCDIVRSMYATGDLHRQLGVEPEEVEPPSIQVSDAAAEVLREASQGEAHDTLRLEISTDFRYGMSFAAAQPGDFEVTAQGLTFLLDRGSAKRANGLSLDYDTQRQGFAIDNPNEPPKVQLITPTDLQRAMAADDDLHLYDVRTDAEREIATIPGATQLTPDVQAEAMKLPKDTPLYFHCHHGGRSQQAAEMFVRAGFTRVFNVKGGIDGWAQEVDPSVSRY